MSVAYVNKQESVRTSGSTSAFSATLPTGYTVGNLLVLTCFTYGGAGCPTVTTPTGWTTVINGISFGPDGNSRFYIWVKQAVTSEATPSLLPSISAYFHCLIEEYSGQDTVAPLNGSASSSLDSDTNINTPAITTTVANTMLVYTCVTFESGGTNNPPAGSTSRHNVYNASIGSRVQAAELAQATAATVAATNFTRSTTAGGSPVIAATLAIAPAGSSSTVARFSRIKLGAGLSGTDLSGGVVRVDNTVTAAPDATTSVKGLVQLAGDLAGTAASPQIAAGAIGAAEFASGRIFDPTKLIEAASVQRIADSTLGASAANIDLSSLPATFAHLFIVCYLRGDAAAAAIIPGLRFNGDSAGNYDAQEMKANSTTLTGAGTAAGSTTQGTIGNAPAASAAANVFGPSIVFVPNYANTTGYKTYLSLGHVRVASGGLTDNTIFFDGGFWASTAAVNRVTIVPSTGNFVSGSRVSVYGLG